MGCCLSALFRRQTEDSSSYPVQCVGDSDSEDDQVAHSADDFVDLRENRDIVVPIQCTQPYCSTYTICLPGHFTQL